MSRIAEFLVVAAILAVLALTKCAETKEPPPRLTHVEIHEWTATVDKNGEPAHWVSIEFRSVDGAYVKERFIARERDHAMFANSFYACIDEKVWPRQLQPCD